MGSGFDSSSAKDEMGIFPWRDRGRQYLGRRLSKCYITINLYIVPHSPVKASGDSCPQGTPRILLPPATGRDAQETPG